MSNIAGLIIFLVVFAGEVIVLFSATRGPKCTWLECIAYLLSDQAAYRQYIP